MIIKEALKYRQERCFECVRTSETATAWWPSSPAVFPQIKDEMRRKSAAWVTTPNEDPQCVCVYMCLRADMCTITVSVMARVEWDSNMLYGIHMGRVISPPILPSRRRRHWSSVSITVKSARFQVHGEKRRPHSTPSHCYATSFRFCNGKTLQNLSNLGFEFLARCWFKFSAGKAERWLVDV